MFTIKRAVRLPYLEVFSGEGELEINGIPCIIENVARCDTRVDLEHSGERAFLVEHVLGCLKLAGIDSALIFGACREYDLTRETFKDAKAMGRPPSSVLGNSEGTLDLELYRKLVSAGKKQIGGEGIKIEKEVSLGSHSGNITVEPFDGLEVAVRYGEMRYTFNAAEAGEKDRETIASAKTPYLAGYTGASLPHVVGDVLGDICGIGGIRKGRIVIEPKKAYHKLTIGALRQSQNR